MLTDQFGMLCTFASVTFAWIFFRANSLSNAFLIIKRSITGLYQNMIDLTNRAPLNLNLGISKSDLLIGVLAIVFMEIIHLMQNTYKMRDWIRSKPGLLRWSIYYAAVLAILLLGVNQDKRFIYFQF